MPSRARIPTHLVRILFAYSSLPRSTFFMTSVVPSSRALSRGRSGVWSKLQITFVLLVFRVLYQTTRMSPLSSAWANLRDFYFDASYRPCALQRQFISFTEKAIKQYQVMNEVRESARPGWQESDTRRRPLAQGDGGKGLWFLNPSCRDDSRNPLLTDRFEYWCVLRHSRGA
jgi:hypothetical protein